jgi:hypothetical protein
VNWLRCLHALHYSGDQATPFCSHMFTILISSICTSQFMYSCSTEQGLIIGRPEAVYYYEVDGRGPCWAFDGEKKFVGWFRGYLICVIEDQRTQKNICWCFLHQQITGFTRSRVFSSELIS